MDSDKVRDFSSNDNCAQAEVVDFSSNINRVVIYHAPTKYSSDWDSSYFACTCSAKKDLADAILEGESKSLFALSGEELIGLLS